MRLSQATSNTIVKVIGIESCDKTQRLREIGLVEGASVEVISNFSDNLIPILVKGVRWAIDKETASKVFVCYSSGKKHPSKCRKKRKFRNFFAKKNK